MRQSIRFVALAAAAALLPLAPREASARAFAGVDRAIVDFRLAGANPALVLSAVDISLAGGLPVSNLTGRGIAAGGCSPVQLGIDCTLGGSVTAGFGQSSSLASTLSGGFLIRNASLRAIDAVYWSLDYSAFNPGGPAIGASVDDPLHEFAAFSSQTTFAFRPAFDAHACDTRAPTAQTRVPTGRIGVACGVAAPNDTLFAGFTAPLEAGQTVTIPFSITIGAEAGSFVPAPASAAFLLAPLIAAVPGRRRGR